MKAQRHAFTLVELLVVIAIIGILVSLTLPAVNEAREAARRTQCKNNLMNLSKAMIMRHDAMGSLPPMARSQMGVTAPCAQWEDDFSWMIEVFPFIELSNSYDRFDRTKCLNHGNNKSGRDIKAVVFGCPSDGIKENQWGDTANQRIRTNYAVNAGNTNYGQQTLNSETFKGSPFGFRKGKNFASIDDGLSNTMMMGEVITVGDGCTGWGGPISDTMASYGGQTFNSSIAPNSRSVFDKVTECPNPQNPTTLNGMPGCTAGASILEQQFAARSRHRIGVHISMCDASVHFIVNGIDPIVYDAIATSKGKEPQNLGSL